MHHQGGQAADVMQTVKHALRNELVQAQQPSHTQQLHRVCLQVHLDTRHSAAKLQATIERTQLADTDEHH